MKHMLFLILSLALIIIMICACQSASNIQIAITNNTNLEFVSIEYESLVDDVIFVRGDISNVDNSTIKKSDTKYIVISKDIFPKGDQSSEFSVSVRVITSDENEIACSPVLTFKKQMGKIYEYRLEEKPGSDLVLEKVDN